MANTTFLTSVDVNVFSLGGSSLLDSLQAYDLDMPNEIASGRPIQQIYAQGQVVAKGWNLSPPLMSSTGGTADTHTKVNSVNVTAFTLTNPNLNSGSSRSYANPLRSLNLRMSATTREGKAPGDIWKYPVITNKSLTWEFDLHVPGTSGSNDPLMTEIAQMAGTTSDNLDGHLFTPSITINGITITAAGVLSGFRHSHEDEGLQVWKVTLAGRAPDNEATAYPAAPTGTTTLLELALNTRAAVAVSTRNRATGNSNSVAWAGDAVITGCELVVPQTGLVMTNYTFEGFGALTPTIA